MILETRQKDNSSLQCYQPLFVLYRHTFVHAIRKLLLKFVLKFSIISHKITSQFQTRNPHQKNLYHFCPYILQNPVIRRSHLYVAHREIPNCTSLSLPLFLFILPSFPPNESLARVARPLPARIIRRKESIRCIGCRGLSVARVSVYTYI